ncbi:hypothetical protein PLICRDRAFT_701102 [Plicaturopsis crispa FD-325 SS-3]|nr:hypothetical protein PLICRDRAFT_701102 [Plicaturopsis crispa FD-325 SS-3]
MPVITSHWQQLRIDIPAFEERGVFEARTLFMRKGHLPTKSRSKRRATARGLAKQGIFEEVLSIATVQSLVSNTDHSIVYRATLDNNTVILKCSVPNEFRIRDNSSYVDLEAEAQAYQNKLGSLRGIVVPEFYGFYTQEVKGEKPIGCLVLEDFGDCVETFFYELSFDDRVQIAHLLATLHRANSRLDNFSEQNVVCRGGRYRLINFHDLKSHTCKCTGHVYAGELQPEVDELGCLDLFMDLEELDIWSNDIGPHVVIAGGNHSIEEYPSQEDIDFFFPADEYNEADLSANLPTILTWLQGFKSFTGSREEYKANMPHLNIIFGEKF